MRHSNKLYGALAVFSLIMAFATAGASDNNTISLTQAITQGVIYVVAFVVFLRLAGAYEIDSSTCETTWEPHADDEQRKAG